MFLDLKTEGIVEAPALKKKDSAKWVIFPNTDTDFFNQVLKTRFSEILV